MRERFRFALRAAGATAVFASNFLLFFAIILWYGADDAEFRRGVMIPFFSSRTLEDYYSVLMVYGAVFLFIPAYVFLVAWGSNGKNIDVEALRFFSKNHPGRVYFVYPYRLLRYLAILLSPRASTPR